MFFIQKNVLFTFCLFTLSLAQIIPITGVQTGINNVTGARPLRRNILDFQNDVPSWSLYIQALTAMQTADQNDKYSWYQVMGLHGRPYVAWDGVGANPFAGSYSFPGYCPHSSILFPTWHRPYVAMYEQILASHVQTIAAQYGNSTTYKNAADNFRLPYWDWATAASMPEIANVKNLTITTPSGVETVPNPLYAFAIPNLQTPLFPANAEGDGYLALPPTTLRDPDGNGVSRPNRINAIQEQVDYRGLIYDLFTRTSDYSTFATDINPGTSIEIIHGNVHVAVGGSRGHMTILAYSAFDPIFMLHHCQVDRLFAMWQAIHPDSWIPAEGEANQAGTYTIPYGQVETSSTPLTPFYSNTKGDFWTSDSARALPQWGYSYPEISDWDQTAEQLTASVTAHVNALYGELDSTSSTTADLTPEKTSKRRRRRDQSVSKSNTTEWFIRVSVNKNAAGGSSFNVRFFLGEPPANKDTWCYASNLVGTLTSLVPMTLKAKKGKKHGEIPLTKALATAGILVDDVDNVAAMLADRLEWRIQKIDGTEIDVDSVPSLNVQVISQEVSRGPGFPSYGGSTSHEGMSHTSGPKKDNSTS